VIRLPEKLRKLCNPKNLILLIALAVSILRIYWLALILSLLWILYRALLYGIRMLNKGLFKNSAKSCLIVIYAVTIIIIVRMFCIDIFFIPSGSMENTLLVGDVIVVNKLVYGPKLPSSLSWLPFIYTRNESRHAKGAANYMRLSGISTIKRSDVIVYQLSDKFFVVKRCVAVAGDVLSIANGKVIINNRTESLPAMSIDKYQISCHLQRDFIKLQDTLNALNISYILNENRYELIGNLPSNIILTLKRNNKLSIAKVIDTSAVHGSWQIFAQPPKKHWTVDNMGPFKVPYRGFTIALTPESYSIYKKAIERTEYSHIDAIHGNYVLNGEVIRTYTFSQNFYFLMGDNRCEALDSRYVGFVPEQEIIGKAQTILLSNNNNVFRFDRLLKTVEN
jgi:signal peptidase I